jgi:branched-chain amino acid transport system substrate-binding protein
MAIDDANAAGGVNGRMLKLVTEDDASKPDVARTVVTKLITQDKAIVVLGEVASTRSMAAAPICQQYKVPMISPASTNPVVTDAGDYVFRVCFTDDFQAAVVGYFAFDQGCRNVAIFKDIKNDYSVAFAANFSKEIQRLGGKVVGEQVFQEGDTDFKAQLTTLAAAKPDAILVPGYYSEVGTIARQAREVGIKVPLLGGDGWDSPKLVPGAGGPGAALEGCFFSNHYFSAELKEEVTQTFLAAFKAKFNVDPDALAALGYDAARLCVDALKRAGSTEGPKLRDAIATTKDFAGVTGRITLDAKRNARKAALILQVRGDRFHVFKSYTPEQIGQ